MGIFDERSTANAIALEMGIASVLGGISTGLSGFSGGYVATSATTIVAVRATTYTEPASAMQMEVVSSSASDAAAGTGTRTLRLTYYDNSMNGPYTEDITMNGTTAVATVATNIRFIEKMESLTVGSNGTNVGTISLREIDDSPVYASIAVSDGITFLAHHYVPPNRKCFVTRIVAGTQGASGNLFPRVLTPLTTNAFEKQLGGAVRVITAQPSQIYDYNQLWVAGPCRVTLFVRPDANTANTVYATLYYVEV